MLCIFNFPSCVSFELFDLGCYRYISHKNSPYIPMSKNVFIPTSYFTFGTPSLLILGAAKLFRSSNVFRNFIISQYVHSKASIHITMCTLFSPSPLLIHVCKQYFDSNGLKLADICKQFSGRQRAHHNCAVLLFCFF